mgnify:FL=1|jgi:hypothetical protein
MSDGVAQSQAVAVADHGPTVPRFWQLIYFLLTLAFCFLLQWTLFPRVEIRLPVTLILMALLLLLTLKRWTGAIFLCILQLHAFFAEAPQRPMDASAASFPWLFLAVALIVMVSRYRTLQERDNQSVISSLGTLLSTFRKPESANVQLIIRNLRKILLQLVMAAGVVTFCAVAASWLLASVPLLPNTIREVGLNPSGYRLIILGLKLFSVAFVSWIAINELVWRSLSRSQAGIYLRSTFLSWIHRDFRMVVKRRIKSRRSGTRSMEPATGDASVDDAPLTIDEKA